MVQRRIGQHWYLPGRRHVKTLALIPSLFVCFVLGTSRSLNAQRATQAVREASRSVVTLQVFNTSGQNTGQGSGFLLRDGRVATNSHVVAGAAWVEVLDTNGEFLASANHAEVISTALDLAILPAISGGPEGLRLTEGEPTVGDPIWVFGTPQGLSGTLSSGIVSGTRLYNGTSFLQISAPISTGSSGGPVLNELGEVIGVTAAMLETGQNLNFAVPSRYLDRLSSSSTGEFLLREVGASDSIHRSARTNAAFPPERRLPDNVLVRGSLTDDDDIAGEVADVYWFDGIAGESVRLRSASYDFDTQVFLGHPDGDWHVWDDDGGEGTNSDLTARLPTTGTYLIFIKAYREEGRGLYEVQLHRGGQPVSGGTNAATDVDDRWLPLAQGINDDRWFWDSASRTEESGLVRFWTMTLYQSPRMMDSGERYDSARSLIELRCAGRQFRMIQLRYYSDGSYVEGSPGENVMPEWFDIPPESIGETFLTTLCDR